MRMKRDTGKRKSAALLLLAGVLLPAGCGTAAGKPVLSEGQSDLAYIQDKGTLVVGITDMAPMDFLEGDEWEGFDADLARKFAARIGVEVEFQEIDWDRRDSLLENGTIDCIWNGMTMTEQTQEEALAGVLEQKADAAVLDVTVVSYYTGRGNRTRA